LQSVLHSSH